MVKTHDGWKYFKGINHERLKQGKKDQQIIFRKIKELNAFPTDCEFIESKGWNNQHDYQPSNPDINVTIEVKRRFLNSCDEFPFKGVDGTFSSLIPYKKYEHLKEFNGWLYLQYNDGLFRLEIKKLTENDFVIVYPFKTKHVSINLACFDRLE